MPLSPEFKELLLKHGVPEGAFTKLETAGIRSAQSLGNRFDDRKDVTTWVTGADLGDLANATLIGLKQLWRECDHMNDRAAKRKAEGVDEDLDAPWPDEVSKAHASHWNEYYHFPLKPYQQLTDNLMGRLWREYSRNTMTLIDLSKVQTIAVSQINEDRRRLRVSEGVDLVLKQPDMQTYIVDIRSLLQAIWLLMTGYAIIGLYEVDSKLSPGKKVVWAPWPQTLAYHDMVSQKAFKISGQGHVATLAQLLAADRAHRTYVLDLVRNQGYPLGEALHVARMECAHEWAFFAEVASDSGPSAKAPRVSGPGNAASAAAANTKAKGFRTREERLAHGLSAKGTVEKSSKGRKFCKHWNDSRGCNKVCPDDHVHACDVEVSPGKACGATDHNRIAHQYD